MNAVVPWDDPLRFCESADDAIASVDSMFRDDWRGAARRVHNWAKDASPDPFAAAVHLALDREMPVETVQAVFRSLCDHRQSLFAQKATAIIGWAEATAGLGPTGDPNDDITLWTDAWVAAGEAPPESDIHDACLPSILQALRLLRNRHDHQILQHNETGIQVCDEFLRRLVDPDDTECAIFAVSVLKDTLTVSEGLYLTYKGLFGGVLDILYWPAMAGCAGERVRASLVCSLSGTAMHQNVGTGKCERRISSAILQVASLTQEAP